MPPECLLSAHLGTNSLSPGRLMLEDLPYERFRRAENCSLLLSGSPPPPWTTAWLTHLTPQTTPHLLSQRHSRWVSEWLSLCWASSQISLHSHSQRDEHSMQANASLAVSFRIYTRSRAGTQQTEATPPHARIGQWPLWRQGGRHSNRLSDLLFIFCLAGICGNVADDIVTFGEVDNRWGEAKRKTVERKPLVKKTKKKS